MKGNVKIKSEEIFENLKKNEIARAFFEKKTLCRGAPAIVELYCSVLKNSSWVSAAATLGPGVVVPAASSS